jgi:signal transduction histidine kinase
VQLSQEIRSYASLLGAERGEVAAHPVLVIADDVLSRVSQVFKLHGVSAGKSLEVECRSSRSRLHVDSVILARVLINMIKNALEASPPGGTVRLTFERHGGVPVFKVWNSGTIPEHVKPRIFERSYSTKAGSRRGFGTYSMKLFGEKVLKGKVSFFSSDIEGTTFQIELP